MMKNHRPYHFFILTYWFLLIVALLGLAAGCGGDGDGLCRDGQPMTYDGRCIVSYSVGSVSFKAIQGEIFDRHCTSCHFGPFASESLRLTDDGSYDRIVGVPSVQDPSINLIEPGDPENSYIWIKLVGTDERMVYTRMPRDGPWLPDHKMNLIREWILAGAPNAEEE